MIIKLLNKLKKKHIHVPTDPVAINIMRAHTQPGQTLSWRCVCGKMVNDNDKSDD